MRIFAPPIISAAFLVFIASALDACRTMPLPAAAAGVAAQAVPRIAPGTKATYPEAGLVSLRNLEPLDAKTGYFEFDNECLALDGGTATAIAQHEDRVLVRYEPPKKKFYGVCPSGSLFFIKAADFATMDERYRANIAGLEAERQLVERLLAGQPPAQ